MLDRRANFGLFMSGEIVEHDDVARPQRRYQHLLDVGTERGIVDRSIEDGGGCQLGRTERCDDRVRLPVAAGRVIRDTRAPRTARVAAQQIRGDTRFIHEHVLVGIVDRERRPPLPSGGRDITAPLFVGVDGFF